MQIEPYLFFEGRCEEAIEFYKKVAGAEVVIESGTLPVAVVRPAEPHVRLLSESLRLAKEHVARPRSTGTSPKM